MKDAIKNKKMKRQKIHFQIQYVILLLITFALPLGRKIIPPLLLLLSLNWVIEIVTDGLCFCIFYKKKRKNYPYKWTMAKKNKMIFPLFLFVGLFALYAIGLLYTTNLAAGKIDITLKLPLLAMPLILFTSDIKLWKSNHIKILFNTYILGCLFGIAYNTYHSYINYLEHDVINYFFYTLASFLHHPSYASMFYTFAIMVMIYFLLNKKTIIIEKIFYFLCIPIFIIEIGLLSSKTSFVALFILLITIILYIIFNKKIKKINLLYILLFCIVGSGIYSMLPDKFNRFSQQIKKFEYIDNIQKDVRYVIWTNAIEVAKENALIGVGTGDVKDALKWKYAENLHFDYYIRAYNAHNQYLQISIALGIVGLLLFVAGQLYAIYLSFRKKYFLYFIFVLLIFINFLTEAMLERQSGVSFFAVFNALLCFFAFVETKREEL